MFSNYKINYIGYLTAPIGLGVGARNYLSALWRKGIKNIHCVDVTHLTGHKQTESIPYFELSSLQENADINILHVNAYDLPNVLNFLDKKKLKGSYKIGVWAWETSELPVAWHDRYDELDEIWSLSDFTTSGLAKYTLSPILTIPYIVPSLTANSNKRKFGLQKDCFCFLFNFDYESVEYRKNPNGLIEAFKRAFKNQKNVQLVIKTNNHANHQDSVNLLNHLAKDLPITFINETFDTLTQHELIASCDAYVSLHRAEGFGLGMAEAMSIGKIVMATGWSGNLDFMNTSNSLLIKYELIKLNKDISLYPANTIWAEPNLEDAAKLMRRVFSTPSAYTDIQKNAKKTIKDQLSLDAVGSILYDRLALICQKKFSNKKFLIDSKPLLSPEKIFSDIEKLMS